MWLFSAIGPAVPTVHSAFERPNVLESSLPGRHVAVNQGMEVVEVEVVDVIEDMVVVVGDMTEEEGAAEAAVDIEGLLTSLPGQNCCFQSLMAG